MFNETQTYNAKDIADRLTFEFEQYELKVIPKQRGNFIVFSLETLGGAQVGRVRFHKTQIDTCLMAQDIFIDALDILREESVY